MNSVMRLVKESTAVILEQSYVNECFMKLSIRKQDISTLTSKMEKIIGVVIDKG